MSERLVFSGHQGQRLSGLLEHPPDTADACAVFAHCFTCSKDSLAAARISRGLARHGIAVLRFDFTGIGLSGGDFSETTLSTNVDDLVAAAAYMRERFASPCLLVGHSLGGTAALMAATRIDGIRAVATIGAPAEPEHVRRLLTEVEPELERTGEATVIVGGQPFRITRNFLDDLERQSGTGAAAELGAALLIFHSPDDVVVEIDNAAQLFKAARHPRSFVALDGADHLLTRRADAEFVANVLATWARRYVPGPALG